MKLTDLSYDENVKLANIEIDCFRGQKEEEPTSMLALLTMENLRIVLDGKEVSTKSGVKLILNTKLYTRFDYETDVLTLTSKKAKYPKTDPNDGSKGLTKREYFAALAMQGLMTHLKPSNIKYSELTVMQADELIAALNK